MRMSYLARGADFLWNPWLLGLFLFTGGVLTVGSGFFPFRHFGLWWRETAGRLWSPQAAGRGGLSPFQAVATALGSTIGTGSVAGVAAAIYFGGPGAVFWMWVTALLGMSTSCVEKLLAVQYQRPAPGGRQGGPMFYLRDGLHAPGLAAWFSLACLPAALAGGNLVQAGSIASALEGLLGWDRLWVGLGTALLAGAALLGGMGRVARVSERLAPLMALLYLGSGGLVLLLRAEALPGALALIFSCAWNPDAALGGGGGYALSAALRYGVARGVFTNEAGLGASAMAHGAVRTDSPARQGMWGIFEVFVSTLLVCTVTALVILVSGVYDPETALRQIQSGNVPDAALGVPLAERAFSAVLGPAGAWAAALSLVLFAFSSILGWSCYGWQSLCFLTGGTRFRRAYLPVFLGGTVLGAVSDVSALWELTDLCTALMALPNLPALLLLAPQALSCLRTWAAPPSGAGGRRPLPAPPRRRR